MNSITMNDATLLDHLAAISRAAGERILEVYNQTGPESGEYKDKADGSPLTAADTASHEAILASLAEVTPETPILSEESTAIGFSERNQWHEYWLVDPLDGTKEFLKRNGEFTVNIALIRDGAPVLGAVYAPVPAIMYLGSDSTGAFLRTGEGDRPIRVADSRPPAPDRGAEPTAGTAAPADSSTPTGAPTGNPAPIRVVGSRSHGSDELAAVLEAIGNYTLKTYGSSLKICAVAAGEADIYPRLGPTSEWDTAAAHAVLRAAGGNLYALAAGTEPAAGNPPGADAAASRHPGTEPGARHAPGVEAKSQTGTELADELVYNRKESLLNPHFLASGNAEIARRFLRAYYARTGTQTHKRTKNS